MRTYGYSVNFKPPRRTSPSRRMWVAVTLCVLLPPVGLFLLWGRVRCPIRGKVLVSLVAVASMTAMLAFGLELRADRQNGYVAIDTPVVPSVVIGDTDTVTQAPAAENTPVPANPVS